MAAAMAGMLGAQGAASKDGNAAELLVLSLVVWSVDLWVEWKEQLKVAVLVDSKACWACMRACWRAAMTACSVGCWAGC